MENEVSIKRWIDKGGKEMKELKVALRIARELSEIADTLRKLTKEIESLEEQKGEDKEVTEKAVHISDKQVSECNGSEKEASKAVELDIDTVRNILADISRRGKRDKVRSLISEFGGEKLTDLKPECYEALVERAKRI